VVKNIIIERTVRVSFGDLAVHMTRDGIYFGSTWKRPQEGVMFTHAQMAGVVEMFNRAKGLMDNSTFSENEAALVEVKQNADGA
jgi:hypothetical protein